MIKILEGLQKDKKVIFDLIQKNGPISKHNIQLIANMKLTTLNRIINDLLDKELIEHDSMGESTGGRKPILYNVNSSKFYIIGIDISRTYTQIVITNLRMQILKEKRFLMEEQYSSNKTIEQIVQVTDDLLKELMINIEQICGIGVSAVGPLDREKGTLLDPINFENGNWSNLPIKHELQNIFNIPVTIDNGANSAVLAEYYYGSGKGLQNMAYINCGVGIRTGVITSSRIIRSMNDREDAFGHMVIDIEGRACYCGNHGCVECYSSIPSIVEDFKGELRSGNASIIDKNINGITYADVFEAVNKGDATAEAVITDSAIVFGTALSNYINLLSPELIVLSGPLLYNSSTFYKIAVQTALKKINTRNTSIKFSKGGYFKECAMAVGAAAMMIEASLH